MKNVRFLLAIVVFCVLPLAARSQGSVEEKGDIAFRMGQYEDSKKLYEVAVSMSGPNVPQALKRKKENAERAAALCSGGDINWSKGKKAQAVEQYTELLRLNPGDEHARKRCEEYATRQKFNNYMSQALADNKASRWHSAMHYFSQAAELVPVDEWTETQLAAYVRSRDWAAYSNFNAAEGWNDKQAAANAYLAEPKNTIHRREVQDKMYTMAVGQKDYKAAVGYASTASLRAEANKLLERQRRREEHKLPWDVRFFFEPEAALFGTIHHYGAGAGLMLFEYESRFNLGFGVRLASRQSASMRSLGAEYNSPYGVSYTLDSVTGSFKYTHFSVFADVRMTFVNGAFYLAARPSVNFNSGLKTEYEFRYHDTGSGFEGTLAVDGLITKRTYSLRTEFGLDVVSMALYLFYNYDFVPLATDGRIEAAAGAHSEIDLLQQTVDFSDALRHRGIFGVGLRLIF